MQEGQLAKTVLLALAESGDIQHSFETYQNQGYKGPKTMCPATWNTCTPRTNQIFMQSALQNLILWPYNTYTYKIFLI